MPNSHKMRDDWRNTRKNFDSCHCEAHIFAGRNQMSARMDELSEEE